MYNLQHRKISRLYDHVHVKLVTVYAYEQNQLRGVGGVPHTLFRDARTYVQTDVRRSANLKNAHLLIWAYKK